MAKGRKRIFLGTTLLFFALAIAGLVVHSATRTTSVRVAKGKHILCAAASDGLLSFLYLEDPIPLPMWRWEGGIDPATSPFVHWSYDRDISLSDSPGLTFFDVPRIGFAYWDTWKSRTVRVTLVGWPVSVALLFPGVAFVRSGLGAGRFAAKQKLACPKCGYDLRATPVASPCSECGTSRPLAPVGTLT